MIKKVRDDIFIIENFYSNYKILYDHVINNEDFFETDDNNCIQKYNVAKHLRYYPESFIQLCENYISEMEYIIEKIGGFEIYKKGNFIVGMSIYDEGCCIESHTDIYPNESGDGGNHLLSSVHFLNENFMGGELIFEDINLQISPTENALVVFNSNYRHKTRKISLGRKIVSTRFWKSS